MTKYSSSDIEGMFSDRAVDSWRKRAVVLDDDEVGFEPPVENFFGEDNGFQLVGHGGVTNEFCARWMGLKGCLNVDLHNKTIFDRDGNPVNYAGKVYVKPFRHWCCKPSCPKCYLHGWAVREAGKIEARLKVASKKFGQVEHITCSIPPEQYGLSFEAMRKKAKEVLKSRGVVGGCLIWHSFRYNLRKHYFWSPHFHCLGFILGGFGRCRRCKKRGRFRCYDCDGFKGRQVRGYGKDRFIVKVHGRRITVFGTAWYLLNHSSVKKGVRFFRVATWFGCVSYRKLKVTPEKRKALCPLCRHELVDIFYHGVKSLSFDKSSFEDFLEGGFSAWGVKIKRKWGSGNYEE